MLRHVGHVQGTCVLMTAGTNKQLQQNLQDTYGRKTLWPKCVKVPTLTHATARGLRMSASGDLVVQGSTRSLHILIRTSKRRCK